MTTREELAELKAAADEAVKKSRRIRNEFRESQKRQAEAARPTWEEPLARELRDLMKQGLSRTAARRAAGYSPEDFERLVGIIEAVPAVDTSGNNVYADAKAEGYLFFETESAPQPVRFTLQAPRVESLPPKVAGLNGEGYIGGATPDGREILDANGAWRSVLDWQNETGNVVFEPEWLQRLVERSES